MSLQPLRQPQHAANHVPTVKSTHASLGPRLVGQLQAVLRLPLLAHANHALMQPLSSSEAGRSSETKTGQTSESAALSFFSVLDEKMDSVR